MKAETKIKLIVDKVETMDRMSMTSMELAIWEIATGEKSTKAEYDSAVANAEALEKVLFPD